MTTVVRRSGLTRVGLMAAVVLGAMTAGAVGAEDQQPAQPPAAAAAAPSLKDLLAQGFEITSELLIPSDVATRGNANTATPDAVMITLQKGALMGHCYTEFTAYANGAFFTLPCNVFQ